MKNKDNKNRRKEKKGFTLMEILLVVFIVALVSLAGMVSFFSLRNSSQIDSSQRELANAIKLAQSYAIQGKTQFINDEDRIPCGYGLYFASENEFRIFYNRPLIGNDCQVMTEPNGFRFNAIFSAPVETFKLAKNVSLSLPAWNLDGGIYFSTPNASVYSDGALLGAGTTKIYELQFQDLKKEILINSAGAITEK